MVALSYDDYRLLCILGSRTYSRSGRDLRNMLKSKFKISKSIPNFYLTMYRLERHGLVSGDWRQLKGGRMRYYRITQYGFESFKSYFDYLN